MDNNTKTIQQWFSSAVRDGAGRPYALDEEQAAAVVDVHKNTLVSARAGSGKTHTLVAKIVYMIAKLDYEPSQIMAFVFNKKAAAEINGRLADITVHGEHIITEGVAVAQTFHGFAHKVVRTIDGRGSFGKILVDGEQGADTDKSRSLYIQDVISRVRYADTSVRDDIYAYFRDEAGKIETTGFESPEAYYQAIRNDAHLTLDGRSVKSFSEKIICDFFFEHGVAYRYEPEFYPKNFVKHGFFQAGDGGKLCQQELVKGDFFLKKERFVWEHWAITGRESQAEIDSINQSGVIGEYAEYMRTMHWKKWFYSKAWYKEVERNQRDIWYGSSFVRLIESYRPLGQSRESFEAELRQICERNGIKLQFPSHEDLVKRAWKKQVKLFTKIVVQFIDRTEQQFYDSIDELARLVAAEPSETSEEIRTKAFHQIGITMYQEYLRRLALRGDNGLVYVNKDNQWKYFTEYGTDFSMLLQRSKELLQSGRAESVLRPLAIKAILVDEYQDFSRLFYDNLTSLRALFPDSLLFCVGDDWQAINRFAGSDTRYFVDFESYFPGDTKRLLISNNYRSAPEIVENANHVMSKLLGASIEEFAKAANQHRGEAIIEAVDLSTVSLADMPEDMRNRADLYRYVVTISRLIVRHKNDQRIVVLHRNNKMLINFKVWGVMKYVVRDYVTNTMKAMIKPEFDEKIRFLDDESDIMTAHRSKGIEGDTVILLEVDPKTFPSSDGKNAFFALFGDTPESHWEDEVHLYYVALTRAKKNLYVLWGTYPHNPGDEPEFIKALEETGL